MSDSIPRELEEYYYQKFKLRCYENYGTKFQDFFEEVMKLVHPHRFVAVSSGGGDKGSDGTLLHENPIFAAHCPERTTRIATKQLETKIKDDFNKFLKHHSKKMRWVFVYGKFKYPQEIVNLAEQLSSESGKKVELWNAQDLWNELKSGGFSAVISLLGIPPNWPDGQGSAIDSIESHHEKRVEEVFKGQTLTSMGRNPIAVMHLFPSYQTSVIDRLESFSERELEDMFNPPGWGTPISRPTNKGVIVRQSPGGRTQSYTHVDDCGVIEVVYSGSITEGLIDTRELVEKLRDCLWKLVTSLGKLNIGPPYSVFLSFVGVRGFTLARELKPSQPASALPEHRISDNEVIGRLFVIDETVTSPLRVLEPSMQRLWRRAKFQKAFLDFHKLDVRYWKW